MKLQVAHLTITVEPMDYNRADTATADGLYQPVYKRILIRDDLPPAEQARVLIHELLHACYDAHGIEPAPLGEEAVCSTLDRPLAMLLQANPEVMGVLHLALSGQRGLFSPSEAPPAARRGRPVGQGRTAA